MDYIICHYGEIALKGKNRKFFEEKLSQNIKLALGPEFFVKRISGRVIIKLKNNLNFEQKQEIEKKLKNTFGLVSFSFAKLCRQNIKEIKEEVVKGLKDKDFTTFKIKAQRSEKRFPLTSQEINEQVGSFILNEIKRVKVKLNNPDIICYIEIVEKYAFIYFEKISGQGGLPVGVSGKAISLLSGGIDSPVASWQAMKRGLEIVFVHFHALPYTSKASIEKIKDIVKTLKKFQPKTTLYLIPFADIQKEILLKAPAKLRVILYRRMMFKIAEKIAEKNKAKAFVTGENLGQVASQTLENITIVEKSTNLLILRPLITDDKIDIIKKAENIGTYKISILPQQDCCSRFLPKHPETRASLKEVEKAEKELNCQQLISSALKKALSLSC